MLADFDIPRLSNDMKIVVQKNHLGGQIWYRSLDPSKKRSQRQMHMILLEDIFYKISIDFGLVSI